MNALFKLIVDTLLRSAVAYVGRQAVDTAKIQALKLYLRGLAGARRMFLLLLALLAGLAVLLFGVLLLHVALLLALPSCSRIWVAFGLGLFYAAAAGAALLHGCREKTWLRVSGAERAVQSVLNRKP